MHVGLRRNADLCEFSACEYAAELLSDQRWLDVSESRPSTEILYTVRCTLRFRVGLPQARRSIVDERRRRRRAQKQSEAEKSPMCWSRAALCLNGDKLKAIRLHSMGRQARLLIQVRAQPYDEKEQ
eukprot:6212831-Pleurochrysis_carterae.AAC.1